MNWTDSALPRDIVRQLDSSKSLEQLSEELKITDARVLWYLEKLEATGHVRRAANGWIRTEAGTEYIATPPPSSAECTVLPGRTVYDFQQAFADAEAGMFGTTFVQAGGEHGGRVPYERVVEFNERLLGLIAEYFGPDRIDPAATPKYGFHWVLTPTDLHPLDDR